MAAPQQRFYSIIFCLMLLSAISISAPSANQTFPASSRRSVQLTYATATTLPEAESLYTYGFLETEALKKEFSKPRHHKTITTNKNPGIQKILGILAKKQSATVLLTFKHSVSVSSQLHLAFAFAPKPSLTITSKNPLENWQKELINTLIKKDSFWVRHPLGIASGVSIMSLMGLGLGIELGRFIEDKILLNVFYFAFKNFFLSSRKEFFFGYVLPSRNLPLRACKGMQDDELHYRDGESVSIPAEATIAFIWISRKGAITKLIENNTLTAHTSNEQLKVLLFPKRLESWLMPEIEQHKSFLQTNNYMTLEVNSLLSHTKTLVEIFKSRSELEQERKLMPIFLKFFKDVSEPCATFFSEKFTDSSTQESTIIPYSNLADHFDQIKIYFMQPDYLIRYPELDGTWHALGNLETATTEIIVLPSSALLSHRSLPIQKDGEGASTDNGSNINLDLYNIPHRIESIKKSIVCIINDATTPYSTDESTSTMNLRCECDHATKFSSNGHSLRFDDFFISHEPTSSTHSRFLHYTASEPLGGHDSAFANEEDDTNDTMKMFTCKTPKTTLELTYQAAAAYVNRIVNASEIASGRKFNMSNIHFETENLDSAPNPHQHEALTQAIAWTAPDHEPDDFKRFEADIVAALHVIDREADLNILKTSASQTLSSLVLETQGAASSMHRHSKYNILLAQDEHRGAITARSQLNSALANKHWQLVVFGKTIISTNNNRYFANLEPGATPGAYKITTNINPEGIECRGYKSAIIKIAQALKINHLHMQSDAAEADRWAYTSPLPSTKSPLAISSPQAGAGSSIRRSSTPFTPPATQSDARAIFEILNLGPIAAWCTSLGETEAPTYNHVTIVCLELVTLQSKSTKRFMSNRTKEGRKYIFFCTAPQKEITEFMKGLKREQKDNIFIVSNYAKAKMLDDAITLTCASGTSALSLTRLQMLLTA